MKSSELKIRTAVVGYDNDFNAECRTTGTSTTAAEISSGRGDDSTNDRGQYHQGFFDCVAETIRFLVGADGLTIDENFKRKLLQHLQQYFTGSGVKNYKPVQVGSTCDLSLPNSKTNGGGSYNKRCLPQHSQAIKINHHNHLAQKILVENNKNILNIFNNTNTTTTTTTSTSATTTIQVKVSCNDGYDGNDNYSGTGSPDIITSDTDDNRSPIITRNTSNNASDEPLDMSLKQKRPRLMAAAAADEEVYVKYGSVNGGGEPVLKKFAAEECLGDKKTCTSMITSNTKSKSSADISNWSPTSNKNSTAGHHSPPQQHQFQQPPSRLRDILESKNSSKTNGSGSTTMAIHKCRYSPSSPDKINSNANSAATVIISPSIVHFQGKATSSLHQHDFLIPSTSASSLLSISLANPVGPTTTAPTSTTTTVATTQSRDLKVAAHLQNWLNKKRVATATANAGSVVNDQAAGGTISEFCTQFDRHPSLHSATNFHNKPAKISMPIFALHPTGLFYFSTS